MILFLYGKDNFRSLEKLKEIVSRYKNIHKTGLNLKYFDLQKNTFEDFRDVFKTKSFFKERKFFILKNAFSSPNFKEKFLREKEIFLKSENVILFYERKEVAKKDPFFVFLLKNSRSQEFSPLEKEKLKNWLKKEISKYDFKIESEAEKILINYLGNNLWQLSNEIKKLVSYKQNEKKIKKEDVESLVAQGIELNIFKTIDFIAKKQKKEAIFLLHKHLEKGNSPLYLLTMINFQFRNLLILKEIYQSGKNIREKIKKLNWHPFLVKKSWELCQRFTLEELKKIYQRLFQVDLAIKRGKIDPKLALDLLIAKI